MELRRERLEVSARRRRARHDRDAASREGRHGSVNGTVDETDFDGYTNGASERIAGSDGNRRRGGGAERGTDVASATFAVRGYRVDVEARRKPSGGVRAVRLAAPLDLDRRAGFRGVFVSCTGLGSVVVTCTGEDAVSVM